MVVPSVTVKLLIVVVSCSDWEVEGKSFVCTRSRLRFVVGDESKKWPNPFSALY